jgi:hypothetical protein
MQIREVVKPATPQQQSVDQLKSQLGVHGVRPNKHALINSRRGSCNNGKN